TTPRVSTPASTIRMPAGRAAGCGAQAATGRRGSMSSARARVRWRCTSRCGRIRWRSNGDERDTGAVSAAPAHPGFWRRQEGEVTFQQFLFVSVAAVVIVAAPASAQQVGSDNIGGVVTVPNGPEAGVWVIAETTALPTRFIKSVVTDDQGRYLIPDLPKANYTIFARGYGLVDSA